METTNSTKDTSKSDPIDNFKEDVGKLKETVIELLDKIVGLDIKSTIDHQKAVDIVESLKNKLDNLSNHHLKPGPQEQDQSKKQEVVVEQYRSHQEEGIIGGFLTYIALKSPSSYMIGTWGQGLKIIENEAQIYSEQLPNIYASLADMIYIKPLDCYLLDHDEKIYRKDIDDKPPYIYLDLTCNIRAGASFRYSEIHERLVIIKDWDRIAVVNLQNKEVEIDVEKTIGHNIEDFKLFGENEDRVVSIADDGYILLYSLNYSKKTGALVGHSLVEMIEERDEKPSSVAVCDKNQHVLVDIGKKESPRVCSRMILLTLNEDSFVKKAVIIDQLSHGIGQKYALECHGYVGTHLIWLGLSTDDNGFVQIYDFDTESGELEELEEKRVNHQEFHPFKILRLGNGWYYAGGHGQVMKINLSF